MSNVKRGPDSATEAALKMIARRFKFQVRLACEMYRDGYLRLVPEIPDWIVKARGHSVDWRFIREIYEHYGLSYEKFIRVYNAGYIDVYGLDLHEVTKRYMQRKQGEISVWLLCHLFYDEKRPKEFRIKEGAGHAYLSTLKIDGKLEFPEDLDPYLDKACGGDRDALKRVALWMRCLIESVDQPHGWAFYGLRLALAEGCYGPWDRPTPSLRKWSKRRKLAKMLRDHYLLRGCVSQVAKPGKNGGDYSHFFHRPGKFFWDL